MKNKLPLLPVLALAAFPFGCLGSEGGVASDEASLTLRVVCAAPGEAVPTGAVACGLPFTAECAEPPRDIVVPAAACVGSVVTASPAPLRATGSYEVEVRDAAGRVCASTVTVLDRRPPVVVGRTVSLWPPNHRTYAIRASDCVEARDACDPAPRAYFTWGTVDEADDATGDGHTAGDLRFDGCGVAQVTAERSGQGDGRLYELGVRVFDRSGNAADAVCRVVVPHDQSGRPAVRGPAQRTVAAPACT